MARKTKRRCKKCQHKKVKGMKTVIEWRVPKNGPNKKPRPIQKLVPVEQSPVEPSGGESVS